MSRKSLFPPVTIEEASLIARTILQHNAGLATRRLTIFDSLGRQPDSSTSRALITASSAYGLTEGGYQSDIIKLTDLGRRIAQDDPAAKLEAVIGVEIFRTFYDRYKDALVPATAAAVDFLKSMGVPDTGASKCLDIILENGKQVGLIRTSSGKERILSIEYVNESLTGLEGQDLEGRETPRASLRENNGIDDEAKLASQTETISTRIPAIHIDIQIHISADAKPEQIDQIFASMAKHLYGSAV
ncbi:MAG: hypothetical protein KIT52_08740 [Anaerolineae bacterium]|nr:hypothetical protein [Anaerolineae bacterium]